MVAQDSGPLAGRLVDNGHLFLAILTDGMGGDREDSFRWAIGAMAIARSEPTLQFGETLATSLSVASLDRMLKRIDWLISIDPLPSFIDARIRIEDARAEIENRIPTRVLHRRRLSNRLARATAAIQRFGGLAGTVDYLRKSRR